MSEPTGFLDFFDTIPDHRVERRKRHSVGEILLLTFCGVIAGCDSWDDIELFGKTKLTYLRKYFAYAQGVPSDDTLRRFFRVLDPELFESCFIQWVESFQIDLTDKVVAVDGKKSRRSFDKAAKPMHLVSAFVSELGISLGQVKTAEKSNEIKAIPELLALLDISGSVITIDAMGCQSKIVEKIIAKEADYVIGLKGNQGSLNADVRAFFEKKPIESEFTCKTKFNKGHGRIESRQCTVSSDIDWLKELHPHWKELSSVVEINSERIIGEKTTRDTRYYISSLSVCPEKMIDIVRGHWGIENKLHWVLDMTFGDDQSRIRKGNAPRNIAIIKKAALNLLQAIKKTKPRVSLKAMRKMAGWDDTFLDSVLFARF